MQTIKKELGQYMTPYRIVTMILDTIGYNGDTVLTKSIMEPSFGNGAFLAEIVLRIIEEGKRQHIPNEDIAEIINNKVYGIEKDIALYNVAIRRLNNILAEEGIPSIAWNNLIHGDTLIEYKRYIGTMDFCVGNPPFVRIHNIPEEYREIVKDFKFVNGMIDLYVVFYEIGLYMLNNKGKLGYITPNSFFKNTSQASFRNYLLENKYLSSIFDFKTSKIFSDASTYTCICILDKDSSRKDLSINYREYKRYDIVAENTFEYNYLYDRLLNKPWSLAIKENMDFIDANKALPNKIKDTTIIQNGVATNMDKVFVIKAFIDKDLKTPYIGRHTDKNKIVYFNYKKNIFPIETTILHRCIKESKFTGTLDNTYIIFPYKPTYSQDIFIDGKPIINGYEPISETELKAKFPNAYTYLLSLKSNLDTRDMEKRLSWFLFARSQGLANSCYKKIVFKHVLSKEDPDIKPCILDEDVIVYSGIFTTIDISLCLDKQVDEAGKEIYIFNREKYNAELKKIRSIYASKDFAKYCSIVGKDMANDYVHISTKLIKEFGYKK